VERIPGDRGQFFEEPRVQVIAATIARRAVAAPHSPPRVLPENAYHTALSAADISSGMHPGERRLIDVTVRNTSPVPWSAWKTSGLLLGNRWADDRGEITQ